MKWKIIFSKRLIQINWFLFQILVELSMINHFVFVGKFTMATISIAPHAMWNWIQRRVK